MATLETINIGNIANDGSGDDLREAFIKVNNNFTELNSASQADIIDGENLGTGNGIFAQKSEDKLQFKSLVAGSGISMSAGGSAITITGTPAINQLIVVSDSGSVVLGSGNQTIRVQGGSQISTRVTSDDVFIDVNGQDLVQLDTSPHLGGDLNGNGNNITNVNTITSTNIESLVYNIDVRNLNGLLGDFDFNGIVQTATNLIEWLTASTDVDFGTFTTPVTISVDNGSIVV